MGPALEGIGLSCGVMAEPGAVSGFDLSPAGLTRRCVEGCSAVAGTLPAPPAGLTGTAYLSLIGVLLRHGVLDERGVFGQGATPLAARIAARQGERRGEPCLDLGDGLYLAAGDVEEVLKVKAAFNLALQRLLQAAELSTSGLVTVYLAGAMGRHVVPADLERLGFLPPDGAGRCAAVGNASLTGAGALLLDEGLRERLHILSASVRVLDLAADTDFDAAYLRRMVFEYV